MRWLFTFAAVLTCAAQTTAPAVIQKSEPEYSEEARLAAVDGTVKISLLVDADGNPTDFTLTRRIGFGLDEKALAAVATWKFKPGTRDGVPAAVRTSVEINFALLDNVHPLHIQSFTCAVPEVASRPAVLKSEHPPWPGDDQTVSDTISFAVDDQGIPANLHVKKISDPKWEEDVIAAIRQWRFQPSTQKGVAVSAPCTLSFAVGKLPPAGPYQIGGDVSAPHILKSVEPVYPDEARRARAEGTVVLSVVVDASGHATEIKIIRPLGLGLDEKAVEAVKKWKFQPAMRNGEPVPVQVTIEVNFRLLDR